MQLTLFASYHWFEETFFHFRPVEAAYFCLISIHVRLILWYLGWHRLSPVAQPSYWPRLHFLGDFWKGHIIWQFTPRHGGQRPNASLRQLGFLFRSSNFRTSCQFRILVSTSFSPPFHCCWTSPFPYSVNVLHFGRFLWLALPIIDLLELLSARQPDRPGGIFWAIMWRFYISPPFLMSSLAYIGSVRLLASDKSYPVRYSSSQMSCMRLTRRTRCVGAR